MSRNFELLQNLGREQAFSRAERSETPFSHGQKLLKELASADPELSLLAQRLFLTAREEPELRVVSFSCVIPERPEERLCARIAVSLAAQINRTVCLVDSNAQASALDEYLGVDRQKERSNKSNGRRRHMGYAQQVGDTNLSVVALGSEAQSGSDPCELVAHTLRHLLSEFNFILIDGPSLPDCGPAITLARVSDGVVLILNADGTRRETAMQAKSELEQANVPVLGVVLNHSDRKAQRSLSRSSIFVRG